MTKRKTSLKILILLLLTVALTAAITLFATPVFQGAAEAEQGDHWHPYIVQEGEDGRYVPLSNTIQISMNESHSAEIRFLVYEGEGQNLASINYEFIITTRNYTPSDLEGKEDAEIQSVTGRWIPISAEHKVAPDRVNISDGDEGEVRTYREATYTFGESQAGQYFVYFRQDEKEVYNATWRVNVLEYVNIEITSVTATYMNDNLRATYTGEWISGGLEISVTTALMGMNDGKYDSSKEELRYSVDGLAPEAPEKVWRTMSSAKIVIDEEINGKPIYFRLRDRTGTKTVYAPYSVDGAPVNVRIDPNQPAFGVSATTTDIDGNGIAYENRAWSCNTVRFSLTDAGNCISDVRYQVSTDNGLNYGDLNQQIDGVIVYDCDVSIAGLRFRAYNAANVVYDFSTEYYVNIDRVQPGLKFVAQHNDPSEGGSGYVDLYNNYSFEGLFEHSVGYVNGGLRMKLYNKGADGSPIDNPSGVRFYYAATSEFDEGGAPVNFGAYREIPIGGNEDGTDFYAFTDSISNGVLLKRAYKVYAQSGAGMRSEEYTVSADILNSVFEITVGEITYETLNNDGWTSTPIKVTVKVPTDSHFTYDSVTGVRDGYTIPTMRYQFFYAPTNILGVLYPTDPEEAWVEPINPNGGEFVETEEGMWNYVFLLSASAESNFIIYAVNEAGKKSANEHVTPEVIKIDTVKPEPEIHGYMESPDVAGTYDREIKNGEWVNGRVRLRMAVKDGISGITVRVLHYATSADGGKPLYDDRGNLIWQEGAAIASVSSERDASGALWYWYELPGGAVGPSGENQYLSDLYGFRVTTGSGISADATFLVNIDSTKMELTKVVLDATHRNGESQEKFAGDVGSANIIQFNSICSDEAVLTFFANDEQMGKAESNFGTMSDVHFGLKYRIGATGVSVEIEKNVLTIPLSDLPEPLKGSVVVFVSLISEAKGFDGTPASREESAEYEIHFSYNRKPDAIASRVTGEFENLEGSATTWRRTTAPVEVYLSIEGDSGSGATGTFGTPDMENNYTFYYYRRPSGDSTPVNEITNWTLLREEDMVLNAEGGKLHVRSDGTWFLFEIDFTNSAFNGTLVFSAVNEAGFRMFAEESAINLMIDNTVPVIEELIGGGYTYDDENKEKSVTYYNSETLKLAPPSDVNRAPISWFYYEILESDVRPAANPTRTDDGWILNGWTKLEDYASLSLTASSAGGMATYKYMFYAVNDAGGESGGTTDGLVYTFVIDPSEMTGTLGYSSSDGYFDATLNMYTFMWKESVTINLLAQNSNTEVSFWYRVVEEGSDESSEWLPYGYNAATGILWFGIISESEGTGMQQLVFEDAVNGTFYFMARNRAGKEFLYREPVYIAIDTEMPELEVTVTMNGATYVPGESFGDSSSVWSPVPLMINLEVTTKNPGGVIITYTVEYKIDNQTETFITSPREVPAMTFTTDRLDGFGKNRDAVIHFYITGRANGKQSERSIHVRVDQVVPVFTMTGHGTNADSTEDVILSSGDWTNREIVRVSKAEDPDHKAASTVTYSYSVMNFSGGEERQGVWEDTVDMLDFDHSLRLVVTATSLSGLTYTEEYIVRIDTIAPIITFDNQDELGVHEGGKHYIDLRVRVQEENIEICEYICTKGETRGFAFDPTGYILSTSSVNNNIQIDPDTLEEYRGYVKVYVRDFAGNEASFELYVLPFALDINNVTLSDADLEQVASYSDQLAKAQEYMEQSRVVYFENLISRLNDRINTLQNEIDTYRAYLERLAQRTSFELKSDYWEMYDYLETYNNYEAMGQAWLQDAIRGDRSSKYYAYFENLQVVFGQLQSQMDKVIDVEDKTTRLPAINVVVATDYNDVIRVYDEYMDLSADQKSCFTSNLYTKLFDLKKKCEVLLLSDAETGVSLDADFAPGAKVRVEVIGTEMESYRNAQASILSSFSESDPRAVVSLYRISLTGAASQTATGEIEINMPIPEEYRQYIAFAVYKLKTDGSMAKIDGVYIEGDGRSVTFKTDELSTFVLCARANVQLSTTGNDEFGTFMGLALDAQLIRTIAIIGISLFVVVFVVIILVAIRHRRFLNTYNRAYKSSIYRKGIQQIPKGNTLPAENPFRQGERVREKKDAY